MNCTCGEEVLGSLRVCYDCAKLCPVCHEEPTNPNEVCSDCLNKIIAADALDIPPIRWFYQKTPESRNALQRSGLVHPYTCGNNRSDEAHRQYQALHGGDLGLLLATENGWVCPTCGYTQPFERESCQPIM